MFTGAYPRVGGLVLAAGTAVVARLAPCSRSEQELATPLRRYLILSSSLLLACLFPFVAFSLVLGIMHTGGAGSWSYPQDYLAGHPIAWLVIILPLFGILSPLDLAVWKVKQ